MCTPDIFLGLLAILFPPIAVWIKVGICSADSIINIALCCLGYVPGLLHAWYIILKFPEADDEMEGYQPIAPHGAQRGGGYQDPEGNRVTYYYVAHEPPRHNQPQPHDGRTYGTTPPFQQQQYGYAPAPHAGTGPPPPPRPQQQQPGQKPTPHPQQGANTEGSGGPVEHQSRPPPTYAEAVTGDYKVQTQD